ncbi:MAG: hypothetical protein CL946_07840 [Ectothiorhodospiraceae bacterium]|nr:hypothetical protein [Ectothiorhodospiraceae bacterium]
MNPSPRKKVRTGHRIERAAKWLLFGFFRLFVYPRKLRFVERDSVQNILVIRQHNQLGDMLCVVPLLHALRKTYPKAKISLLARPLNAEILRGSPFLDEVIVYDKFKFFDSPVAVLSFGRDLRDRGFDLVLVPSTVSMSVTSDVLAFLTRCKRRIGPGSLNGKKNVTGFLYNHREHLDWRDEPWTHQAQRNLDIASILVLEKVRLQPAIGLADEELRHGRDLVNDRKGNAPIVIGFHPGAAKIPNRWDALNFAEIANRCAEIYGAHLVISAGPNDTEPLAQMKAHLDNDALIALNLPIREVASIIAACDLFVTNDTGIMHVAAAVGTTTLSLFGPTPPLEWAPPGSKHRFILGRNDDVQTITVDRVWENVMELAERELRNVNRTEDISHPAGTAGSNSN